MLHTKCRFICPSGFREEELKKKMTNQKQELLWWSYLLTGRDEVSNLYRGPSIDASYYVPVNLAKQFQRRFF